MSNAINPDHYNRLNPQPKDVIRAWGLNFNLGSAVKYISRAGHKDDIVQDLKKAREFLNFEIDALEKSNRNTFTCKGTPVGNIEITGLRKGKSDEEIDSIINKTLRAIIDEMAGVELEECISDSGETSVHIAVCENFNPVEVHEYIQNELKARLSKVL